MTFRKLKHTIAVSRILPILALLWVSMLSVSSFAQVDRIRTGTGLGVEKVRIAVADFKPLSPDKTTSTLLYTFDATLFSDLQNAGIFDMVSKSFNPLIVVGVPQDIRLDAWSNPPTNAQMVAFGNLQISGSDLLVQGWLFDTRNVQLPQVLGKQYREAATDDNARLIAHRFADEIIFRLGGGIPGICETKIYFVSTRTGHKEIWAMDYDGAGQRQLTHLNSIALSPHVSPDGARVAFSGLSNGWNIMMYSLDLGRIVSFPHYGGGNFTPAWSSDGTKVVFSSSVSGESQIYVADADGRNARRISPKGPDVSPVFNPKTNAQVAWVSGRTGLPQIYLAASDGTNSQRLTDGGYAVSPAWSPNGQFIAFSWIRSYGPGILGGDDLYIMDIATRQFTQLTHGQGRNDYPSWSPDNRHIVFQRDHQIWTMLADGTQQRQLTTQGGNEEPNWSWK